MLELKVTYSFFLSELNEDKEKLNHFCMTFLKKWKANWELKSLSFDELFNVIVTVIMKQLDGIKKEAITPQSDLENDLDADSVDLVAILLLLEVVFKNASPAGRTVVPTDKAGDIGPVEDILDIIYEVLLEIETKMDPFVKIEPNFALLDKQERPGRTQRYK